MLFLFLFRSALCKQVQPREELRKMAPDFTGQRTPKAGIPAQLLLPNAQPDRLVHQRGS